ncbi:hypothetical protein BC938DRAFT_473223 [Jimgerdemannia flammicorona]|uniref:Uncharacterized protein n=1 Tax=Jimgerdemannia flammicorona TaxID=994334 RepID=A0A433Q4F8_9FUNG|nr:hypothetical protein BC938DRAFT_473223 [Jimgerdemannia flammicorona]
MLQACHFNTLLIAKGPSLVNTFTLASPYIILANYVQLDWAESYGVKMYIVSGSVGRRAY